MERQTQYIAIIELGKDMSYGICSEGWGDIVVGDGASLREAKESFICGIHSAIESHEQNGQHDRAEALREALSSVVYRYNVRSFLKYYKLINLTQFAKYIGINDVLIRQYKSGQYMSEERALEIERGFKRIAEDLSAMG